MNTSKLISRARELAAKHTPSPAARLTASTRFYQVISLWEALALHGNHSVPTITSTLRGNAIGFRDQTWPRRLGSIAVTAIIGFHLLGGYPNRYIKDLIEDELAERALKARLNGAATAPGTEHIAA